MKTTLPLPPQLKDSAPLTTLNLEPVDPQLGHYYRYTPRSQLQTLGKRMLEQTLLANLAPKDKEHQRKKVLRQFFSDISHTTDLSPVVKTNQDALFWRWVKSLNPDNVNSEERYKSMSYEFLDRLLSKKDFCTTFLPWLQAYGENLSSEDDKTRDFISFIQKSAEVKRQIESIIDEFLADWNPNGLSESGVLTLHPSLGQPVEPGFYLEGKCFNERCSNFRRKSFFYFGSNVLVNYSFAVRSCICVQCKKPVTLFTNVGLHGVLFKYEGRTVTQEVVCGKNIAM